MIVLDTDVLIEIFDKHSAKGDTALRRLLDKGDSISITAINLHEILYGMQKYAKPVADVIQLPVIGYTKEDARLSAKLELEAEKSGVSIRRTDAMIAAITLNNDSTLYTLYMKHFEPLRAFGLKLFR